MKAVGLPPLPSLVIWKLVGRADGTGVTTMGELNVQALMLPVVSHGGNGVAQVAGQLAMHRPMLPGSSWDKQLFSHVEMQSAAATLPAAIKATPAMDAMNRFMFYSSLCSSRWGRSTRACN
jgi:hypothetical protein